MCNRSSINGDKTAKKVDVFICLCYTKKVGGAVLELDFTGNLTNYTKQQRRAEQMAKDKLKQDTINNILLQSALQLVGDEDSKATNLSCIKDNYNKNSMEKKIHSLKQKFKAIGVSEILINPQLKELAADINNYDLFSGNVNFFDKKNTVELLDIVGYLNTLMLLDESKNEDWVVLTDEKHTEDDTFPAHRSVRILKLDNSYMITATYTDL